MGLGSSLKSVFGGGGDSGGKVGFATVPQTPEAIEARKRLFAIATGEPPKIPTRQIAPLPPVTEERELARSTAKELVAPQDIFSLPEVQGIINKVTEQGNLLANRIGRSLQSTGSFTATTGRDVLGRAVSDVQSNLAASLAPFASEERARRRSLIPVLEGLGLTEEDRQRGFEQAELDALFNQAFGESQQTQTFTIPALRSVISDQPAVIPTVQAGSGGSSLGGITDIVGPLLTSVLGGGQQTGGGGGSGGITGQGTGGDVQLAMQLAAMFSDLSLKENVATIESALDKVNQLDGKVFDFINDIRSGGVIAQEIEKVMPEAVGEKDGHKTVDYTAIIGLLINAVKELSRKVNQDG